MNCAVLIHEFGLFMVLNLPISERTSSRKCAKYQRSLCPRIYGHGGNTAKNPSRALHIRGGFSFSFINLIIFIKKK